MYDDARYTIYNIVEQQKIMNKLEQGREYREYWGLRNKNNGKGENSTYDEGCEGDIPDDIGIPCKYLYSLFSDGVKVEVGWMYHALLCGLRESLNLNQNWMRSIILESRGWKMEPEASSPGCTTQNL